MGKRKSSELRQYKDWESDYVPERRTLTAEAEGDAQPRWVARALYISVFLLVLLAAFAAYLNFRPLPFDPARWQTEGGAERGRMLAALLEETDFVGFPRSDVEVYLGKPEFDERQFWYDLGPVNATLPVEPRAAVGEAGRLYASFSYDGTGTITDVLYSYRRPILGSEPFDSTGWFGGDPALRRTMFTHALRRLRGLGFSRSMVRHFLGRPDGSRVRAHYDVGRGGAFIGANKALILQYDHQDVVTSSEVTE